MTKIKYCKNGHEDNFVNLTAVPEDDDFCIHCLAEEAGLVDIPNDVTRTALNEKELSKTSLEQLEEEWDKNDR